MHLNKPNDNGPTGAGPLSVSKQRVDIAKVASAHSATEDELAHAWCTPLPGQPWKQKFQVVGLSGAQGISPPA